jgi:hypothetical protein
MEDENISEDKLYIGSAETNTYSESVKFGRQGR